jgi:aryl-alcohol dehydrogenase-like predicted oxidoreductase
VQNELSPRFRSSEPEVEVCASSAWRSCPGRRSAARAARASSAARHAPFGEVARERGVSPQRVALAWLLALSPVVVPIPGASRPESILDSAEAPELVLTDEEMARLSG